MSEKIEEPVRETARGVDDETPGSRARRRAPGRPRVARGILIAALTFLLVVPRALVRGAAAGSEAHPAGAAPTPTRGGRRPARRPFVARRRRTPCAQKRRHPLEAVDVREPAQSLVPLALVVADVHVDAGVRPRFALDELVPAVVAVPPERGAEQAREAEHLGVAYRACRLLTRPSDEPAMPVDLRSGVDCERSSTSGRTCSTTKSRYARRRRRRTRDRAARPRGGSRRRSPRALRASASIVSSTRHSPAYEVASSNRFWPSCM